MKNFIAESSIRLNETYSSICYLNILNVKPTFIFIYETTL